MPVFRNLFFPILWLVITTFLFLLPGSAIPKINWLDKIWFDKWVHIGIFGLMVILWVYALAKKFNRTLMKLAMFIALLSLLYGISIEFAQEYFVRNRSFDIGDILADAAGCGIGLAFSMRYIKK